MSVGAILMGIAVLAVVVAYLARPFRPTTGAGIDQVIETWVEQVQAEELESRRRPGLVEDGRPEHAEEGAKPTEVETAVRAINYCPQCGQRVDSGDRFCSGCGTRLPRPSKAQEAK